MEIVETYNAELSPLLKEKIFAYSEANLPPTIDTLAESYLGCYLYEQAELVGGITGHCYWNIMHVDFFWIDERLRGQGQGSRLLHKMETIAKREKCHVMHLETFSFEAPRFYQKQGFIEFGKLENVPINDCDYYFFKKELR